MQAVPAAIISVRAGLVCMEAGSLPATFNKVLDWLTSCRVSGILRVER